MQLFYTPDIEEAKVYALNEAESRHCVKVLRLQEGAFVQLVDGKGGFYTARIAKADPKHCALEITAVERDFGKRPYRLHIAIAPTKNTDRFEWFLEKATEAGIDEITPLICGRSERRVLRTDRLFKRITSAVKQSLRAYHPVLNEPIDFADFMKGLPAVPEGGKPEVLRCIAHCGHGPKHSLKETAQPGRDVLALIGPEGDFTPEEVAEALRCGFIPLGLGETRLRTETAGLAVCFELSFLNR
ncbi:16S rRNA (uracil1498-N3)-methyltransferase [Anseongella ginsenosidimutans]|uniref:Ribosomal RNA small subunit methyltransferase E n=1 Tax=Anseongella ginsenosidimutans TaxID=496056 RepID=A0A4R3KYJ0_9SPHI|nr:16S rRNA (uracil(1498)-N(3))-methyltransferase [Anseongella ginsenosidimutans]QEC51702.1 16S rRNA (uracil(1498)-N(3))-methyltransferase [Anseongella ginsenosidimutans]TCS89062.1 16S rRNA (uracil1498-N3)-methyltransferase [Anseongella ginsenosidimutans]